MPRAIDGLKGCAGCKATKLVAEFGKQSNTSDGLCPYCKACMSTLNKRNVARRKARRLANGRPESPTNKICPGCKQNKFAYEFSKNLLTRDGLMYYCKPCNAERIEEHEQKIMKSEPCLPSDGMQECRYCNQRKPLSCFATRRRSKTHLLRYCRDCMKPHQARRHIKSKYGLTADGFEAMLVEQNHVCFLCGKPETSFGNHQGKRTPEVRKLAVDHCHACGLFRQLLCLRCNAAAGWLEYLMSNNLLGKAIKYIRNHNKTCPKSLP